MARPKSTEFIKFIKFIIIFVTRKWNIINDQTQIVM